MRKLLIGIALFILALPAQAATDLGDGHCVQTDGVAGVWDGTTADDNGCITEAEYEFLFSAGNLLDAGVIVGFTVNDDGTTTLDFGDGILSTVETNPLDRKVAANPELEPDAPTVREVLFRGAGGGSKVQ